MRAISSGSPFTTRALGGTHVVQLGISLPPERRPGLRGFAIHRRDHTEDEAYWLTGMKVFPSADPGRPPGTRHSTLTQPIQDFLWSDYSAKPDHSYTYRVLPRHGPPGALTTPPGLEAKVTIATESLARATHTVAFNRGIASSQEYERRFDGRRPGTVGGDADPAWAWLSRGAAETIRAFIRRAGPDSGLRVAAYELHVPFVLEEIARAAARGAEVRVIMDADPKSPGPTNEAAIAEAGGLPGVTITRRNPSPQDRIAHNKFIVLAEGGVATAVLTGSTNFSRNGVYGHSNVVHVVDEPAVAGAYLDYWEKLNTADDSLAQLRSALNAPLPPQPPQGTMSIFSPRRKADALAWYASLAAGAERGLFMTFPFGMNDRFKDVFRQGSPLVRYALMESLIPSGTKKEARPAKLAEMRALRARVENLFAVGARLPGDFERWVREGSTGLSQNVEYIHTKYMLVDPLGPDPIVVTGSANFSEASSTRNDENMLVIRGDERVADIYLTEFLRLWDHYAFREWASATPPKQRNAPWFLKEDDSWWEPYFNPASDKSRRREYFAE